MRARDDTAWRNGAVGNRHITFDEKVCRDFGSEPDVLG